jgi:hypothetical protein
VTYNLLIVIVQVTMLVCLMSVLFRDESVTVSIKNNNSFQVFVARFGCTVALHLQCGPEFTKSMKLMKYVNNNPDSFR